ncbi:MAG: carbohydrate porin [Tannerella sp.]|jgi:porin|nr:carbohydrate porin [Tannerella sp.]
MKYLFLAGLLPLLPMTAKADEEKKEERNKGFTFGASYVGDLVGNFAGGIRRGTAYMGLANLTLDLNTEQAGWWRGGEFFVKGGNSHGEEASAQLIGDFQVASNIEAGNHTFLYELWYKQRFGRFTLTAGLQDMNVDYAASEGGALFNNSYFGIHSVCAANITPPIYPLTALGASLRWDISRDFVWQAAVYDGRPDDFSYNPYNVKWSLSARQGYLGVTEGQWNHSLVHGQEGAYKLGAYYRRSDMDKVRRDYGFYLVADQGLSERLSLFVQAGLSPKSRDNHYRCIGGGLNYKNFSSRRPDDRFGFAFNHACFVDNPAGDETVFEAIYHLQVTENIYLRPDIQYIIHPAGTGEPLNNALVGILRFGLDF